MVINQIAKRQQAFMGIDPQLVHRWRRHIVDKMRGDGVCQAQACEQRPHFELLHLLRLSPATEDRAGKEDYGKKTENGTNYGQDDRARNSAHAEERTDPVHLCGSGDRSAQCTDGRTGRSRPEGRNEHKHATDGGRARDLTRRNLRDATGASGATP